MNISVITACKNRYKPLVLSLNSWLLFDEIKEVIIVDWSSDESISHLTELDPRVKVITVPGKKYFNQPQPLNLAASIATGDSILKFDVDHMINPYWNFLEGYPVDENTFVSGKPDYESPEYLENGVSMVDFGRMNFEQICEYCDIYSPFFKSLFGILHVTRENFVKCGGFNENLGEFYGFEDDELQRRLELLGLNHTKLKFDTTMIHIPHPDCKRYEHFMGSDNEIVSQMRDNINQYYSGDAAKYQLEYAIAQYHTKKNKEKYGNPTSYYVEPKTNWDIRQINSQQYIATEMTIETIFKEDLDSNNLENFPPVYYVTLEDCVDRQNELEEQFAKYGVVPNAIKSKRHSESNDVITGKYVYQLTGPTKGCIVSHLKAIKTWYESEESDYAFFCEDDLSLKTVQYWNFKWEEFIERLPDDCECVQLMSVRGDFDGVNFRDRKWDDWSETAYIMNRDYAKKLIDNYCIGDTFNLELKDFDVMPIGENILFTNAGKVYTFPMFVENVDIPTTDVNDLELENGQKPNHIYASEYVYNWWKTNGKQKTIDDLMGLTDSSIKKVVDCFTYFNEKEILELRINLLKDYVDKFVIVDANYTHSGIPKDYSCKKVIKELGLPEHMIEVIEVDLSDSALGPASDYEKVWDANLIHESREKVQRNAIAKCLDTNNFADDTVFIVSDCDEIINPKFIPMMSSLARTNPNKVFKADLDYLQGRPDFRTYLSDGAEVEWRYSLFVCLKSHMEAVPLTNIRSDTLNPYEVVWPYTEARTENDVYIPGERMKGLGWHFSWMGTNQDRILKSKSFCHFGKKIDCLGDNTYGSAEMDEFFNSFVAEEGVEPPTGYKNTVLKKYPLENLPEIIFEIPRLKNYFFPEPIEVEDKTELEQLLYDYSLDTENPQHNFNLGLWYEKEGHTAPALSYFLRCAERSTDDDFVYEALLKSHHCYDKQGTRDGTAISLLQQAICLVPKRPEAYFLLSRFHERRQQWNDSYKYASLGLSICNFDYEPLVSDVEYPGRYGLLYEKAISGYWWGKGDQSREIFKDLLDNYELSEEYLKSINENLEKIKN